MYNRIRQLPIPGIYKDATCDIFNILVFPPKAKAPLHHRPHPPPEKSFESPWQPSTKTTHLHSSSDLEGARRLASLPRIGSCQGEGGSHCGSHCRMRPSDGLTIDKPSRKLSLHEVEDIARDPRRGPPPAHYMRLLLITAVSLLFGTSCSTLFLNS